MTSQEAPNLTRSDASERAELLRVYTYQVELDLTDGAGGPGHRTFRSKTTASFAAEPEITTYIDVVADHFHSVALNGHPVDTSSYTPLAGIQLPNLAADNQLVIDAELRYTNTGEGLHRFVDPLDGEVYLYTQFEAADAKRMYACFDQPDLKAIFTLSVRVPEHWCAVSNAREADTYAHDDGTATITFEPTVPLSTYVTALVAGPYHAVHRTHDGIDLGLYCRKTLAEHLDSDELFAVTAQGFDFYHANFGVRYPFGKYDQLFVPEFNAGAMENAGCVTFRETDLFRGRVTEKEYERRGMKIMHELAHMWFGDLVTMKWWNDLWLNESFATYAGILCQASATRWADAWTTFANALKTWARTQDQLPSTHPIASDAPDVHTAESNFDGITYAKGASVLKQLVAYVGRDAFMAGIRDYFETHAYGNTTLDDLLRALSKASGRDLDGWAKVWLESSGVNIMSPRYTLAADGTYETFAIEQTAHENVATDNTLRPHRLVVGLYDDLGGRLEQVERVELDVAGSLTEVPQLVGHKPPALVLINDEDLTYCKVRLDDPGLRAVLGGRIGELRDPLARAVLWSTVWDMVRDGEIPARVYVKLVLDAAGDEPNIGLMETMLQQALYALEFYTDPTWSPEGYSALADQAMARCIADATQPDHRLAWLQTMLGAALEPDHLNFLERVNRGELLLPELPLDAELRWRVVQSLSAHGRLDSPALEAELEQDRSMAGHRHFATARALQPTTAAKDWAWREITSNDELSNGMYEALISGFSHPAQGKLLQTYASRYFAGVQDLWNRRASELAFHSRRGVAVGMFPMWTSTITPDTLAMAREFLTRNDVPSPLQRIVAEGTDELRRAIDVRAKDRA
jgi:aminopeptidase N